MKTKLEKFIADNEEQLDNKIPDAAILGRILQQMEHNKAIAQKPKAIVIPFRTLQWAAAALVFLACGLAVYNWQHKPDSQIAQQPVQKKIIRLQKSQIDSSASIATTTTTPLPELKNIDAVDRDITKQKTALLARFTNNSNASRKLVMLASLKDMDSPAKRITAVSQANQFKLAGSDIVAALLHTLNKDPNTNVRLAALDGLARFYRENYIRRQLISSLKTQQNPTVQIALIELLIRMKEAAVLTELDKIVANDSTMNAVKDCAYTGIFKLRKS